ncbi:sok2p [Saccharomyces arboricola H-6]|uniref:Sok2p n=1 Tax=Saccharomyces arboricola (strain H-6 / AS 2.3317 / CBS 10644) TaxID=1160507 RepID=J8LK41_SACAR|nr:sok2p [Saccharomyces arboricola H-6]
MPIGNPINTNDIKPNRMHQESNMSAVSNNEHKISQPTQQQQYLNQGAQSLVPVSYQYVVPEQWPYPQYYQQPPPQTQQQQQQLQSQMYQVQESFQSSGSDSNISNQPSTSVAVPSTASTAALSNVPGSAVASNNNSSSNAPYYYYFPQMQVSQPMTCSYPQTYYYYSANSDGAGNPNGMASAVTNVQSQNPDLEKNYSPYELQQQQQQSPPYPSQPPKISNTFSKSSKSGPPSDSSTGSMSPNSNRISRNSNSVASLVQHSMPNYPQPSTYQYPGFHKTSSNPNSHSPIPARSLTTPTQNPPATQNGPLSYNLPQVGLVPQQQQQQGSPLYDGSSVTPPVKPIPDQETYSTANRPGNPEQQYDPMSKAMNSFQTTSIRHPIPLMAATNATGPNSNSSSAIIRPRVTTTMWEDEKTLCYQVEANGISVVRRADNDMINGTKLLNVTKMTRGRRDGILKAEKIRHVVKIGSMHLKGVWIPFDRALAIAQREKIADYLYPLFIRDIQGVLKQNNPNNESSSSSSSAGLKSISPRTYYQPIDSYQGVNVPVNASATQLTYSSMNLNNKVVPNNSIAAVTATATSQRPLNTYLIPSSNQLDGSTVVNSQNLSTAIPMKQQSVNGMVSPLSYPGNAIISPVSRLGNASNCSKVVTPSPPKTSTSETSEANVGSIHTGIALPRVESESTSRPEWSKEAGSSGDAPENQTTNEPRSNQLPISALTSTETDTVTVATTVTTANTSTGEEVAQPTDLVESESVKEPTPSKPQADKSENAFNQETNTDNTEKQDE